MYLLRKVPIRPKLMIIAMSASGAALVLAVLAFLCYEWLVFRSGMVENLLIHAAMVSENSAAALTFNDPVSARQTLRALNADPHVTAAAIYGPDGKTFARYQRRDLSGPFYPPPVEMDGYRFEAGSLKLFRAIRPGGEFAGTVYLQSDLGAMYTRLRRYCAIAAIVMTVSTLLAYLLSSRLQTAISRPLSQLAKVVRVIANEKDYSVRAARQSEDELGELIDGFNGMLGQIQSRDLALEEAREGLENRVEERTRELRLEVAEREKAQGELIAAHQQLVQISRQAGMAEVATGVLHNVGNVLNSVNVSANLLFDHVQQSKASSLTRVVALLGEHQHDLGEFVTSHPQGKHVLALLKALDEQMAAERAGALQEIKSLRANVDHIRDIVSMQQSYAKLGGVREEIKVTDLVEDSLRLNAAALSRHRVEIIRDYQDVPVINIDKHKALQILVNLLSNAKSACVESSQREKCVTLRIVNGEARVKILVSDNGVGIPPENLTRIFGHGFTTRKDGHGFGLHSAALAARELGGSLNVHSEGPGRGATFTLELPLDLADRGGIHTC
jgi:two-component system, NtrC family, sensor kinase